MYQVDYSKEAPINVGEVWYFPFSRYSYSARVAYLEPYREWAVCIALPPAAALKPTHTYTSRVVERAIELHEQGHESGLL